jgi:hypothetical protein
MSAKFRYRLGFYGRRAGATNLVSFHVAERTAESADAAIQALSESPNGDQAFECVRDATATRLFQVGA